MYIGFFFGHIISGPLADQHGRTIVGSIGSFFILTFGLASVVTQNYWQFVIIRSLVGLGIGLVTPAIFTYLTEMTPTKFRGTMIVIMWTTFIFGELFVVGMAFIFDVDEY